MPFALLLAKRVTADGLDGWADPKRVTADGLDGGWGRGIYSNPQRVTADWLDGWGDALLFTLL